MTEKELAERLRFAARDHKGRLSTTEVGTLLLLEAARCLEALWDERISALNEVERLRGALEEVKLTLETGQPAICCTVWAVSSPAETLLDHVCQALKETEHDG